MPPNTKPIQQPRRKRRSVRRRGSPLLAIFSILVMVVLVVVVLCLFFRVNYIEVTGTVRCDPQEIRTASTIEEGSFLVFINKVAAERNIRAKEPYADEINIIQKFPSTVVIEIAETEPLVYISHLDSFWLIDYKGRLLEHPKVRPENLPEVTGTSLLGPVVGTALAFPAEDMAKEQMLIDLLDALQTHNLLEDVQSIDLADLVNIRFSYLNRFTVNLGVTNDLGRKLDFLPLMVAELEVNALGTIDLSEVSTKVARFIPT